MAGQPRRANSILALSSPSEVQPGSIRRGEQLVIPEGPHEAGTALGQQGRRPARERTAKSAQGRVIQSQTEALPGEFGRDLHARPELQRGEPGPEAGFAPGVVTGEPRSVAGSDESAVDLT